MADLGASGFEITEVVSGGARGADALGEAWAIVNEIPFRRFHADWAAHGKAAGAIRNRAMAEYADALIAMPGGRGTANMIAEARKRGLKVYEAKTMISPLFTRTRFRGIDGREAVPRRTSH